ncbi:hypothetical protein TeGR_g6559, partial [Tetraparma gracilis]
PPPPPPHPRYRSINTSGKAYSSKARGKIGAKKLLSLCGWHETDDGNLILQEVDLALLQEVAGKITRASAVFDADQQKILSRLGGA